MKNTLEGQIPDIGEDNVGQMLLLAERLRQEHGGDLDDSAILAVSEACCIPPEYVRLIVNRLGKRRRTSFFHRVRSAFLALEPDDRRYVIAGTMAAVTSGLSVSEAATGDAYGLFRTLALVMLGMGLWNCAVSPNSRTAAFAGGLFGLTFFIMRSVFAMAFQVKAISVDPAFIVPFLVGGMLSGIIVHRFATANRRKLGIHDPHEERQELLRQLVELQDKLREGEQSMTFVSFDIVGSTRMKELADPLSIEFTFTEYHKFVEMAAKRYGGRVHSTAGDGVTCAFPHPQQAFQAARFVQAGLVELNTFRNKIGVPIQLRAAVHTGTVVAPPDQDISKINFAHVIDIAAHLQKACPTGGIAVSEEAARLLPGGPAIVGQDQVEASNVRAYVWQARVPALGDGSAPPPPPLEVSSGMAPPGLEMNGDTA